MHNILSHKIRSKRSVLKNFTTLPLNQLLSRDPISIVLIPIHNSVMVPCTQFPSISLFETISIKSISLEPRASLGMLEKPFTIDTIIIKRPAKTENILMNPVGVGLPNEPNDLSISKALIIKAPPSILITSARASLVRPRTVANPLTTSNAPGTPRKNFEYLGSYTNILIYLPSTAYEYSTLLLCLIIIR